MSSPPPHDESPDGPPLEWAPDEEGVYVAAAAPEPAGPPRRTIQPTLGIAAGLAFLAVFVQLVVGFGASLIASVAYVVVTQNPEGVTEFLERFQIVLLPLGTLATLLLAVSVAVVMFRSEAARRLAWRGLAMRQLLCVVLLTVPLAVLASEVTNWASVVLQLIEPEWVGQMRETSSSVFEQAVARSFLLVFLAACLLPGLGEEIYCRGIMSRGLVARHGVVLGTLLTAALFGAIHVEPVQACGAFTLGIGLQFVFLATRSLAAPIVLHTLNNALAFAALRFDDAYPIPGVTPLPDGGLAHTPLLLLVTAAVAAACLLTILYQMRTRWQLPDGSDWSPGYVTAESPPAELAARPVAGRPQLLLVLAAVAALAAMLWAVDVAHRSLAG